MKCVVENSVCGTIVFETNKITYMRKRDSTYFTSKGNEYCIYIHFDNGESEEIKFHSFEAREEEWQRIMKCWRSDELTLASGYLTAGD